MNAYSRNFPQALADSSRRNIQPLPLANWTHMDLILMLAWPATSRCLHFLHMLSTHLSGCSQVLKSQVPQHSTTVYLWTRVTVLHWRHRRSQHHAGAIAGASILRGDCSPLWCLGWTVKRRKGVAVPNWFAFHINLLYDFILVYCNLFHIIWVDWCYISLVVFIVF